MKRLTCDLTNHCWLSAGSNPVSHYCCIFPISPIQSKRGAKGMSPELAQTLAIEAMSTATSTQGDALMTLGQARARMDIETILPSAPVKLLDEACIFFLIFIILK